MDGIHSSLVYVIFKVHVIGQELWLYKNSFFSDFLWLTFLLFINVHISHLNIWHRYEDQKLVNGVNQHRSSSMFFLLYATMFLYVKRRLLHSPNYINISIFTFPNLILTHMKQSNYVDYTVKSIATTYTHIIYIIKTYKSLI